MILRVRLGRLSVTLSIFADLYWYERKRIPWDVEHKAVPDEVAATPMDQEQYEDAVHQWTLASDRRHFATYNFIKPQRVGISYDSAGFGNPSIGLARYQMKQMRETEAAMAQKMARTREIALAKEDPERLEKITGTDYWMTIRE